MEPIDWIRARERLTERQKWALLLRWLGYRQREIGYICGIRQPAVSRLLDRAYEQIRASGM